MTKPQLQESERVPYDRLPVVQQASLYVWYLNLSQGERRRVDALDDAAFQAEYYEAAK